MKEGQIRAKKYEKLDWRNHYITDVAITLH